MCNTWGESGAILAYPRAALRPISASRGVIDAVNDVVRHTWMVLMTRQQLVENFGAFSFATRTFGRVQVAYRHQLQSVENRSLVVAGIAFAYFTQRLFVIFRPRSMIHPLPVLVENRERIDVVALAGSLGVGDQSSIKSRCALPHLIGRRRRPDRVIPGPRHAPMTHHAQAGSVFAAASLNATRVSSYPNEWSKATAREIDFCAIAVQEVGKFTLAAGAG